MLVPMTVQGVALDPLSNMPVVMLAAEGDERTLPIWIGVFEANAIQLELDKSATPRPPRPLTHDLMRSLLEAVGASLTKIVVTELRDNTFYAALHVTLGGREHTIDARPSDAIALALRTGAKIFVADEVVRQARTTEVGPEAQGAEAPADDPERLKAWLEGLKPEDFGKLGQA